MQCLLVSEHEVMVEHHIGDQAHAPDIDPVVVALMKRVRSNHIHCSAWRDRELAMAEWARESVVNYFDLEVSLFEVIDSHSHHSVESLE